MSKKLAAAVIIIIIVIIVILLYRYKGAGSTHYYVSSSGNDDNSGLSKRAPWRSLEKVNSYKFKPGDIICFKRGDVWRGQLVPQSGNARFDIKYTGYGPGEDKPVILGSTDKSDTGSWEQSALNIWRTSAGELDIGNIIFNNSECGQKVWNENGLNSQGRFYYDPQTGNVLLFSYENPSQKYNSIECAVNRYIINQSNKSYVEYDGLALKYGAAHGIGGYSTHDITIRNCDISYIGGGGLYTDERRTRYGNGIEFWGEAYDNLVEGCNIWEIYDAGVTNQNSGEIKKQYNITYKNNKIWNCEYSFEYWNSPAESYTGNILFAGNTCSNAGGGWGHTQRPDPSGIHICLYPNAAQLEKLIITNNVMKEAGFTILYIDARFNGTDALMLSRNSYYQDSQKLFCFWKEEKYYPGDFSLYTDSKKQDKDSVINKGAKYG